MASSQSSGTGQGAEESTKPFSVLFVCLGNICRSPAAEGVFTDLVKKKGLDSNFNIDSAGTINYHEVYIYAYPIYICVCFMMIGNECCCLVLEG